MKDINATGPSRRRVLQAALVLAAVPATVRIARAQSRPVTTVQGFETAPISPRPRPKARSCSTRTTAIRPARRHARPSARTSPRSRARICGRRPARSTARCWRSVRPAGLLSTSIQFSEIGHRDRLPEEGRLRALRSRRRRRPTSRKYLEQPARRLLPCRRRPSPASPTTRTRSRAADAPKTWKDLLDPRWRNAMSTKQSTCGIAVRRSGTSCGGSMATGSGRSSPSSARAASIRARSCSTGSPRATTRSARWPNRPATCCTRRRARKIAFVAPPDGLPRHAAAAGIVDKAPHPEAARLFLDWLMSPRGQDVYQNNPVLLLCLAPQGRAADAGRHAAAATSSCCSRRTCDDACGRHATFIKEWNGMLGLCRPPWRCRRARLRGPAPRSTQLIVGGGGRRRRRDPRPLPDLLSAAGVARRRRSRTCGRRRPTDSTTSRCSPNYWEILLNTLVVAFAATLMALVLRLPDRLDPDPHQRAVPAHARTADGGALLRDAAARRAGLEPARRAGKRLHQPALARARRQRRRSSTSPARSASPG